MKNLCSILALATTISLNASAALPSAAYSCKSGMVETFDSIQMSTKAPMLNGKTLWSLLVYSREYAQDLKNTATDGRSSAGYNAGAIGNPDRSLAIGKSSGSYFTTKFINDTASQLTEIELYYDMECNWISKGGGAVSARLSLEISTNGTTFIALGDKFNATVLNTTAVTFNQWLTDEQMDAQKLSRRNVGGIIALPAAIGSIQAGQEFYIRWVTATENSSDKMTYGIDNLRSGTDSDNDGLSNAKELVLGTDPNKADSDGDGMSDGDEISYGTDPLDATRRFSIELKIEPAPAPSTLDNNIVEWPAAEGKYYTLLFSETLTGTFEPVPGFIRLTGKKGERLKAVHSTQKKIGFYRILIEAK